MLTIIFFILLAALTIRLIALSVKHAWGGGKILLRVVFLPLGLLILALYGLTQIALPILLLVGVILLVTRGEAQ